MPDVLLVTRNFPPTSHVSVERAMKLAKYLPEFGWRPTVLTGARATDGLPEDPGLAAQVTGIEVIRARSPEFSLFYGGAGRRRGAGVPQAEVRQGGRRRGKLHPKAWLVPDSQVLWYPFAVQAGLRRARARQWDAVIATSFPPTAIMIAHTIAARLRVPYVADFRDSWTRYHYAPERPAPLAELERRLEARLIRDAAAVVAVDPQMVHHAFERLPADDRPPLYAIQNGYDEEDFRGVPPAELPAFSIVHTGRLRRSPGRLWDALVHALRQRPELHGRLHVWQVGVVDPGAIADLATPPDGVMVHHIPPVSQREAIGYMLGADLLFVEEFGTVMPSKALQYLRASRPVLAHIDGGGLIRDVLGGMPETHLVDRSDPVRAGDLIARLAASPRQAPRAPAEAVAAFSRRETARRYAGLLDAIHERAGSWRAGA
jgi:hypothetical protein